MAVRENDAPKAKLLADGEQARKSRLKAGARDDARCDRRVVIVMPSNRQNRQHL